MISNNRSPFDPDHQYGDWICIGVDGPESQVRDEIRAKALEVLMEQAHNWIPEGHRDKIATIEHPPTWMEDPLKPPGPDNGAWVVQIAWKYTPNRLPATGPPG